MFLETIELISAVSIAINVMLIRSWIVARQSKTHRFISQCQKCGYDTRSTIGGRCPECGEPVVRSSPEQRAVTQCNFCGKSNRLGLQVEGPGGVYICGLCVEAASKLLSQAKTKAKATENTSG